MNWTNIIIGIILLAASVFYYYSTMDFPPPTKTENLGPAFFPTLLATALAFLSLLLVIAGLFPRGARKNKGAAALEGAERLEEDSFGADAISFKPLFAAVGLSFIYVGLLSVLGYLVSTPLFLIALIRLLGYEKWVNNVIASAGLTAALYLLFVVALGVHLPEGIFFS